jgi:site-specific recombinase XerD
MNIEEARKQFLQHLEDVGRAPSTLIAYGKDIEQLVERMVKKGKSSVEEVTLEDLQEFMDYFSEKGYTNKTISRKTNSTKTFFSFLLDKGYVEKDVSDFLKHPKIKDTAPRILSKLEYRALRDAARNDPRTYALLELFLQAGLSISEVSGLKLEHLHLDVEDPYLFIPARGSKLERTVPLNEVAVSALKDYLSEERPEIESDHFFITRTGNPLLVRNIRSTINRYFEKAGVENATVNDLRHTFVAYNLKEGASIAYISKVVGHKRVSTTERYLEYIELEESGQKTELAVL